MTKKHQNGESQVQGDDGKCNSHRFTLDVHTAVKLFLEKLPTALYANESFCLEASDSSLERFAEKRLG